MNRKLAFAVMASLPVAAFLWVALAGTRQTSTPSEPKEPIRHGGGGAVEEIPPDYRQSQRAAELVVPTTRSRDMDAPSLKAAVTQAPEHLRAWAALRGKALRTKAEAADYRKETASDATVDASLELLTSKLQDVSVEEQAKREFAVEHIRSAVDLSSGAERTERIRQIEGFVTQCDSRTALMPRQARGLGRADCAAMFEIILSFAPETAEHISREGSPLMARIAIVGAALKATRRQL